MRFFLVILFSICSAVAGAQDGYMQVWKVQHTRKIKLMDRYGADTMRNAAIRLLFGKLLENAAIGKIPVYRWVGGGIERMLAGEVADLIKEHNDTVEVVNPYTDPATGKRKDKVENAVRRKTFDTGLIEIVRLIEDWEYDWSTGETKMSIAYIAPVMHVYAPETGEYRGTSAMFWVRWENMAQWLDGYRDKEISDHVYKSVWESYFKGRDGLTATATTKSGGQTLLERTAKAHLTYKNDTNLLSDKLRWRNMEDLLLSEILYDSLRRGRAKAYANNNWQAGKELSIPEIQELVSSTDTQIVIDPIDGSENMRVKLSNYMDHIHSYSVITEWVWNMQAGKMNIRNLYVAPDGAEYDRAGMLQYQPLFWVKWKDVFRATRVYNTYNPEDNLDVWLWYDKFLKDGNVR